MIVIEKDIVVKPVSLFDPNVERLVTVLDRYQRFLYGEQFCNLEPIEALQKEQTYALGAYAETELIGIGTVKMKDGYGEIKRMYVAKKYQRSGAATAIISGLELYTRQQNRQHVKLETGRLQFAAISFYEKQGYRETRPFGSYKSNPVSIYFEKNV